MAGDDDYIYDEATGEWRPASELAAAAKERDVVGRGGDAAEVAGAEPAVAFGVDGEALGGLRGVAPVAREDVAAAHVQLALLAGRQLVVVAVGDS